MILIFVSSIRRLDFSSTAILQYLFTICIVSAYVFVLELVERLLDSHHSTADERLDRGDYVVAYVRPYAFATGKEFANICTSVIKSLWSSYVRSPGAVSVSGGEGASRGEGTTVDEEVQVMTHPYGLAMFGLLEQCLCLEEKKPVEEREPLLMKKFR